MATDERIFDATWECKDLFESCHTSAVTWDDDDLDRLEECEADFAVWAHGLRADKTGHSSFDYRLRDRPDIRDTVLNLIRETAKSLDLLMHQDSLNHTSYNDGDQGEDDSDSGTPIPSPWVSYPGSESPPSQTEKPRIPDSPISRHLYYIRMNLDILRAMSIAIKRAGVKFRYERADRALPSAPTSYDNLRIHLAHLILVKPYSILLGSLAIAVRHERVPPLIELLIRKWVHDNSRSYAQLDDLIQSVVVRHNRIQFARKPWKLVQPRFEDSRGKSSPTTKRLKSDLPGPSETMVSASADASPHPNDSQSTIQGRTYHRSPHVDSTGHQLRRNAGPAPLTASLTASGIASSFVLPPVDVIKRQPVGPITKITWTGLQEDYPPRPSIAKGARTFVCPCCYHNLPVEYMKTKTRWRGHVAHDILPYTCVFSDCARSTVFYNTREDWILHMKHSHSFQGWVCEECPVQLGDTTLLTFDSVDSWADHTKQVHNRALTDVQASAVAKMSERKLLNWIQCPLCPRSKRLYNLEEDEHIAQHLHSFALESLPEDIAQDPYSSNDYHSSSSTDSPGHVDYKWSLDQYLDNPKPVAVGDLPVAHPLTVRTVSQPYVFPKRVLAKPFKFKKAAVLLNLDEIPAGHSALIYGYIEPLLHERLLPCLFHSTIDGKGLQRVKSTEAFEILNREDSTGSRATATPPNILDILNITVKELQYAEWSELSQENGKTLIFLTFGKWVTPQAVQSLISDPLYGNPRGRPRYSATHRIKIHIVFFSEDSTGSSTSTGFESSRFTQPLPMKQVFDQMLWRTGESRSHTVTSEQYQSGRIITDMLYKILVDGVSQETNSRRALERAPIRLKSSSGDEFDFSKFRADKKKKAEATIIPSYRLHLDNLEDFLLGLFGTSFPITHRGNTYEVTLPRHLTMAERDELNHQRRRRRDEI
ncbi:hypothetical protein O1611_g7247 [Lasiodiplodia mahajangana]|uniref:Uncharacterized protein n=1 Tax=Lasiodiplodia mahajangana TaxID=1108764 RepID=A0ACC2JG82_9PEZI|nr:hypothetical protein O1611_g7247 [Lasiodiplodia mahajangana]